jgi:hypothetical protein
VAIRFRQSIKLAPGLRLNIGKRGVSLSAGVRGASMTFGRNGTYANAGLPGTGLSVRERIGGGSRGGRSSAASQGSGPTHVDAKVRLEEDGTVSFLDQNDNPLPPALERKAKEQHGVAIQDMIEEACEKRNSILRELSRLNEYSPHPGHQPCRSGFSRERRRSRRRTSAADAPARG